MRFPFFAKQTSQIRKQLEENRAYNLLQQVAYFMEKYVQNLPKQLRILLEMGIRMKQPELEMKFRYEISLLAEVEPSLSAASTSKPVLGAAKSRSRS